MTINQNDMEYLKDMMQQGKITADEANIQKVEMQRVLLVLCPLSSQVRKALNSAVKAGRLVHKKREHSNPEVYYKTGFEYLAKVERNEYERSVMRALAGVCK